MRSDLQDPFQKEFLQVKLFLLKYSNFLPPAVSRRARDLASLHHASSWPTSWLARDLRASELATLHLASSLAGNPASSRVAGARDLRAGCLSPSNGLPSLSFKAIQLLKELIPN
ncbi:UNVERIFIED_CONTAM: hypothetical protein Slati_2170000 [Sesamum latifolium]|uniref:Uncharacterized protein n=1 Tax=Sesamum latifolium TaxID=2727402 RepID=A0AAW2WSJ6_9LAMI